MLIATELLDVHADFVISELNKRDVPVFRFHTEDFPAGSQISISGAGTVWSGEIRTPLRSLRLEDVRAAWLRRPGDPVVNSTLRPESREFAVQQALAEVSPLFLKSRCGLRGWVVIAMSPLRDLVEARREQVKAVAARHHASRVRLFGSVARGVRTGTGTFSMSLSTCEPDRRPAGAGHP